MEQPAVAEPQDLHKVIVEHYSVREPGYRVLGPTGTLWDVPDWADRPVGANLQEWQNPPLVTPGTVHEYNDVRVNLLALALLDVLRWVPEFEQVIPAFLEALRR